jgi:hypothetical protein
LEASGLVFFENAPALSLARWRSEIEGRLISTLNTSEERALRFADFKTPLLQAIRSGLMETKHG